MTTGKKAELDLCLSLAIIGALTACLLLIGWLAEAGDRKRCTSEGGSFDMVENICKKALP